MLMPVLSEKVVREMLGASISQNRNAKNVKPHSTKGTNPIALSMGSTKQGFLLGGKGAEKT